MKHLRIIAISAFTVLSMGIATASYAECDIPDGGECPEFGNPGNGKPVGNSPWDGITGNSGNNGNNAPPAATMDGQRSDTVFIQPGGKDETGPSNANKD